MRRRRITHEQFVVETTMAIIDMTTRAKRPMNDNLITASSVLIAMVIAVSEKGKEAEMLEYVVRHMRAHLGRAIAAIEANED